MPRTGSVTTKKPKTAEGAVRTLSVLIPVYNSEGTIGRLADTLVETLSPHFERIELVLVNDGSPDNSHEAVLEARERHPGLIRYVRLAKNFGEHNAVMCGLRYTTCDAVVIMDDDFQNPPSEALKLVDKLAEGYDVVYSRYDAKKHHWFRNVGSWFNDRVASALLKKPKNLYLSSFKAMNRFLIDTVVQYGGPYPYLDGLILRSTSAIGTELCAHQDREEGQSNYNLRRLVRLWLNMFTSFSVTPLRVSAVLGLIMACSGFLLAVFYILSWQLGGLFVSHDAFPPGWASTIVTITIFGGVQLCVLGMIGEYLGRIFMTQNLQPQYVVREAFLDEPESTQRRRRTTA
jgi:glycosyltransferase involved in cell wall biosynthesis